ncbi:MAG: hypothetical protein WCZ19_02130 [Acholeplasma sp.]
MIENYFSLVFKSENETIVIEVETDFRIRNSEKILLAFNDLYIDQKGRELSVRRFRSQKDIEKTYLSVALSELNKYILNLNIINVEIKAYGDIYIFFENNLVVEIFNDTHLDDVVLYRITRENVEEIITYEVKYLNEELVISQN